MKKASKPKRKESPSTEKEHKNNQHQIRETSHPAKGRRRFTKVKEHFDQQEGKERFKSFSQASGPQKKFYMQERKAVFPRHQQKKRKGHLAGRDGRRERKGMQIQR